MHISYWHYSGTLERNYSRGYGGGICPGKPPADLPWLQFYFPWLYYALQILCFFESLWQLVPSKLISAIFPQQLLLILHFCVTIW